MASTYHGPCTTIGYSFLFSTNDANNPCDAKNGTRVKLMREETGESNTGDGGLSASGDGKKEDELVPNISIYTMMRETILRDVPWGECALSIAREIMSQYDAFLEIYAFMVTPPRKIAVRLQILCEGNVAPNWSVIGDYAKKYWKRLNEAITEGALPTDLSLEVLLLLNATEYAAAGRILMINKENYRVDFVK